MEVERKRLEGVHEALALVGKAADVAPASR